MGISKKIFLFFFLFFTGLWYSCQKHQSENDRNAMANYDASATAIPSRPETIQNPILPGFNPDPCIIRVEDEYYIVTSSFEWFPGIHVYHSLDLVHWEQTGHVLTSESTLNLRGIGNSAGIFAPSIHYHDGTFYVTFTIVSGMFPFLACPNYITTAKNIRGPWTKSVYVNSKGFDPALFFDDDGKCYFINMSLDFYTENITGGIWLQEMDPETLTLKGKASIIFPGTRFGTEGPHIYKHNGYYYLMVAEGGTDYGHQETVARSQNIWGPYEPDPETPLITTADKPEYPIQRTGHASLVETQTGEWYLAFLGSRPLLPDKRSVLGRESFLEQVVWTDDGWLRLKSGGHTPRIRVPAPALPLHPFDPPPVRDDFDGPELGVQYQTLREGAGPDWISFSEKPGWLSMRGRKPFNNLDDQSMVVRRLTSLNARAETCVQFHPESYRQMAGLTCFYDINDFIYLKISYCDSIGRYLSITHQNGPGNNSELPGKVPVNNLEKIFLRVDIRGDSLWFSYSADGADWKNINKKFYTGQLADENNKYGFTGAMVGICAQDMDYEKKYAHFDYIEYLDF